MADLHLQIRGGRGGGGGGHLDAEIRGGSGFRPIGLQFSPKLGGACPPGSFPGSVIGVCFTIWV